MSGGPPGPGPHAPPLDARGLPVGWVFRPEIEITPPDTRAAMQAPPGERPVLLDCRRDDEVALGRIAGSVHIPMDQIERRLDELEDLGARERPLVVYCAVGARSLRVALALRALGFPHARSMAGGIAAWPATTG